MAAVRGVTERLGILHIGMEGSWGVGELGSYLRNVQEVYALASTLTFLQDNAEVAFEYGWPIVWPGREPSYTGAHQGPTIAEIKSLAAVKSQQLLVQFFRLESPGWLEVIGSLNPLKVLADAVMTWRSEKTKRIQQLREYRLALLDRMPPPIQARYAAALLEETLARTEQFALDLRITEISTKEVAS